MADGAVHLMGDIAGATVVTVASVGASVVYGPLVLFTAAGALLGIVVDSDLDHHAITKSERLMFILARRVGAGWLGWVWMLYWWPYMRLMPHRSFWSHFPFVATAIRLAYVSPLLCWLWPVVAAYPVIVFYVWLGMSCIDVVHATLDGWRFR